jgi:N-acylglucosamine-6-phosphate 2-epimerase
MHASTPASEIFQSFRNSIVVSCIPESGDPTYNSEFIAIMAYAARAGGARAIRLNGPEDISAVKAKIDLPIIGYFKANYPGFSVSITPTISHAEMVAAAGADIIELDASQLPHPEGMLVEELIRQVKRRTGKPVIADVSTPMEGILAANMGADAVMTALAGYTNFSMAELGPDFNLIASLSKRLHIPLLAHGRIQTPELARKVLELGAFAVVVGSAITRPQLITERFVQEITKIDEKS